MSCHYWGVELTSSHLQSLLTDLFCAFCSAAAGALDYALHTLDDPLGIHSGIDVLDAALASSAVLQDAFCGRTYWTCTASFSMIAFLLVGILSQSNNSVSLIGHYVATFYHSGGR